MKPFLTNLFMKKNKINKYAGLVDCCIHTNTVWPWEQDSVRLLPGLPWFPGIFWLPSSPSPPTCFCPFPEEKVSGEKSPF